MRHNIEQMKNVNLIIDGSNLLYRVYHVTSRTNSNLIHMFMNSIKKLHGEWDATKIYIAWDSKLIRGEKSFRRQDDDYKDNRDKSKWEDVYEHEPKLRDICKSLGVVNIHPGVLEADDVICYLSNNVPGSNIIISSDHDMLQLITNRTIVHNPVSKKTYDVDNFIDRTGVSLSNYIHYKSLIGDKSDNIAGIAGVGHKTALKILSAGIQDYLTPEDYDKYLYNVSMIDLSVATSNHPGEESIYKYQLQESQQLSSDYEAFKRLCVDVAFPETSVDRFSMFFSNNLNDALLDILK